jgi:hypothetical protein
MHLAGAQLEPALTERVNAWEALFDPFHRDENVTHDKPLGSQEQQVVEEMSRRTCGCVIVFTESHCKPTTCYG